MLNQVANSRSRLSNISAYPCSLYISLCFGLSLKSGCLLLLLQAPFGGVIELDSSALFRSVRPTTVSDWIQSPIDRSSNIDNEQPSLADFNDEDDPFFPEEEAHNPAPTTPPLNQPPMNNNNPEIGARKGKMMENFKEYVNDSVKNRCWMEEDTQAGIELMDLLHKNGLLSLYDPIMEWHMKHPKTQKRHTKTQLTETLRKRYFMEDCKPELVRVKLPSAGIKVRIPCHDAWSMMQDLLTDPRIVDGDYREQPGRGGPVAKDAHLPERSETQRTYRREPQVSHENSKHSWASDLAKRDPTPTLMPTREPWRCSAAHTWSLLTTTRD